MVTGKMPLSTPSGSIYGSRHNFEIIEQDSSFEPKKIRNQNGENERKNIATDTLKKGKNKQAKFAPQRSKWAISRKGESKQIR
ncbi:hypothetical protein [Mucilaginibacter sp.]|uniref:hypothetical protein n=1 Tax=Mucilaginibacter sp. TaxID=1882438 RepID=UPI00260A34DD|nr:hypothetical protein [Mucilaginibacter sp.]MDB4919127.1 hypothetical protein [Mucilaginibacter sp.]